VGAAGCSRACCGHWACSFISDWKVDQPVSCTAVLGTFEDAWAPTWPSAFVCCMLRALLVPTKHAFVF
jgi:hypothetical protein